MKLRPISVWVGARTPAAQREKMPGTRSVSMVIAELEREARLMGSPSLVVETFHKERDVKLDGGLRANAALPSAPGVVVYVSTRTAGALRFACDRYHTWTDNLRAVSLTLEALRGIDRWGVAKSGEQYKGWAALPAPPEIAVVDRKEEAAKRLLDLADCPIMKTTIEQALSGGPAARSIYNQAVKRHHPDTGGDRYKFEEAQACWATLTAT